MDLVQLAPLVVVLEERHSLEGSPLTQLGVLAVDRGVEVRKVENQEHSHLLAHF